LVNRGELYRGENVVVAGRKGFAAPTAAPKKGTAFVIICPIEKRVSR